MKKALVVSDIHYPYYDKLTFNLIKQIAKDEKPDYLVLLGDCIDANGISKFYLKDHEDGFFETVEEFKNFKKYYLDRLVEVIGNPDIRYIMGNHDGKRLEDFLQKIKEKCHPSKLEVFMRAINLPEIFPNIKITQYNRTDSIGKLNFTHGEFHNSNHNKKHYQVYGDNLMYGHLHTASEFTFQSKASGKIKATYSVPCACRLDLDYKRDKADAWVQGCTMIYFDDGNYWPYMLKVIDGKIFWNNKFYEQIP